jgi:hypothetical protein
LIWINHGALESVENFSMTARRRPFVRPCPLCGVAMQASKSRDDIVDFDTFQCLRCETTISERKATPSGETGPG